MWLIQFLALNSIVFVVSCNVFVEKGILWGGEQEDLKRINDWW
jgi:hypothetical protein